jgi:hypothetical protein
MWRETGSKFYDQLPAENIWGSIHIWRLRAASGTKQERVSERVGKIVKVWVIWLAGTRQARNHACQVTRHSKSRK